MKYYKKYKEQNATAFEITKEEAKGTLNGWWHEDAVNDIFENERQFRLYTPYADVWTKGDNGMVPMPGFYGVI